MKKIFLAICAIFVLSGCGTHNIQYVSSVPPEKLCTLYIANTLSIKQFDGENVNWESRGMNAWAMVQIPEGNHTFVADYTRTFYGATESANDVVGTGNFIAGRTYHMFDAAPGSTAPFSGIRMFRLNRIVIRIDEGRPPNS
jgi:hypothetical protein